jgi:hypothetical protein
MVAARWVLMMKGEHPRGRPKKNADLHSFPAGTLAAQAAATVNVSIRLINLAIRIVRQGSEGLIAAVDSDVLSVSAAAFLAALPREEQEQLLAGGPEEMAGKARELRGGAKPVARSEAWGFGVLRGRGTGPDAAVLLWVAGEGLNAAVEALEARGFRYAEPGARGGLPEAGDGNS